MLVKKVLLFAIGVMCCFAFSGCGLLNNASSSSHVHSYETSIIQPTCEERGYTLHICSCGHEYKDTYVSKLGHDWSNQLMVDLAATCTSSGISSRHCSRCNSTTDNTTTAPLGHDFSTEWTVTSPTCTESGKKFHLCNRCNAKTDFAEVSAPLGHNVTSSERHDATCTEEGYTYYHCSRCEGYKGNSTPALGHDYADGICTRCLAQNPDYHLITARTNDPKSFNAQRDKKFTATINFDSETREFISKNLNDTLVVTVEYELMFNQANWKFDDWSIYIRGTTGIGGTQYACKPQGMFSKNTYTKYKFTLKVPAAELTNGYIFFCVKYDGFRLLADGVASVRNIRIAICTS